MRADFSNRRFLFLQGPHGPFFWQIAKTLRNAGCETLRIGFNAGDRLFWPDATRYIAYGGAPTEFAAFLEKILAQHRITDLVLYGEARPIHAQAIATARATGVRTHLFEEGYLRPHWISYEREGTNGHSQLLRKTIPEMVLPNTPPGTEPHAPPAHWGDMRQHIFYGALYHAMLLVPSRRYPGYAPHREISVRREAVLHIRRLALMPWNRLVRWGTTAQFRHRAEVYHICLLQLDHDASAWAHSNIGSTEAFVDLVLEGFAEGAPAHHHLVFKAHPLEDGRIPLKRLIGTRAKALGLIRRVHFLTGGKLAKLLDSARSVVTINSTAAHQALWRSLPVKALGTAVYTHPELVSDQTLPQFFSAPRPPDMGAYGRFRTYLLSTCQFRGSFYSAAGRRMLRARIADAMLDPCDPFDAAERMGAAEVQQLQLVPSERSDGLDNSAGFR